MSAEDVTQDPKVVELLRQLVERGVTPEQARAGVQHVIDVRAKIDAGLASVARGETSTTEEVRASLDSKREARG